MKTGDLNKILKGTWTYRSLHDDVDINIPFNELRFGAGIIEMIEVGYDQIINASLDMGGEYKLAITGEIRRSSGAIEGTPTEGWVYEYFGNLVSQWENGIDQKDVISGSVIRTVQHGNALAGYVATFYMVKH